MGIEIDREAFDESDYERFAERLEASLSALGQLLERPGFGAGPVTLGAELEVSLVDGSGRPLLENGAVLEEVDDPRLTIELDRFNLEANLRHGPLAGRPFAALRSECQDVLAKMGAATARHGGSVALVGILPTLTTRDLDGEVMSESVRFRALSASLRRLRHGPFLLNISGDDTLRLECEDVTYEGAGTSFQVHLRVAPERFARVYNALQLATPVALSTAGNSPTFLGRRLWEETRVALFKQAVDPRPGDARFASAARVSFGDRWIGGPFELFAENVARHPPLLPIVSGEEPRKVLASGGTPALPELRLHQGTVWSWNRAIFDPAEGGHLRVEMRVLPSGPTVEDMLANAAFLVGLGLDLAEEPDDWTRELDFEAVHGDFYRAARDGLAAELGAPAPLGPGGRASARDLALALLPRAQAGLDRAGVERDDSAPLLATLERRVRTGRTGAAWQRRALARAEAGRPRSEALARMFARYLENARSGATVDAWEDDVDRPTEAA